MSNTPGKHLVPFISRKPLVPGKGGRLGYWRQDREIQALKDEIVDMAKVVRRLSQELIDQILFIQDPSHKSPEEIRRTMSRMAGALKQESPMLTSLFQIEDLHPALKQIFLDRSGERLGEPTQALEIDVQALPRSAVPALNKPEPTIFHLLTDQELKLVTLILAGHEIGEAAARMGIAAHTARVYRCNVINKAKQVLGEKGETNEGNS